MWTDKLKSSLEKLNFLFFSSCFFTIDFKICLYARRFDTSHRPHDIFWPHFANSSKLWENKTCQWTSFKFSATKLFSQSFGELTRCSKNMSCGQCEVSKCLAYRHILKSIVKKLEEKNQKFSFFGTWINFNQVCSSHVICRAAHPWFVKWLASSRSSVVIAVPSFTSVCLECLQLVVVFVFNYADKHRLKGHITVYWTGLLSSEGELWKEQRRFTHTVLKDFGMGRGILEPKIHEEIQV